MLLLIIYNNVDFVTNIFVANLQKMTDVENSSQTSFQKSSGVEHFVSPFDYYLCAQFIIWYSECDWQCCY